MPTAEQLMTEQAKTCPSGKIMSKHGYLNVHTPSLPTLRMLCVDEAIALAPHDMTEREVRDFYAFGDAQYAEWAWVPV